MAEIVILNGASSSGKSSIVRAFRDVSDAPYFFVGVDHFNAMRPGRAVGTERVPEGLAMNAAFHQAVQSLATNGWNVIVEHVLVNPTFVLLGGLPFSTKYPVPHSS
jgi:chloramphenicol 3-O phosphotransferase